MYWHYRKVTFWCSESCPLFGASFIGGSTVYQEGLGFSNCHPSSLWVDCVSRLLLQQVIDEVVIDLHVGHKHSVAAVLIDPPLHGARLGDAK